MVAAKKEWFGAGRQVGWLIMVVAGLATIIATGILVRDRMRGKEDHFKAFFCDEYGYARSDDLVVTTPDGDICPDSNGEIMCPASWAGKEFVIYEREPRRLLQRVTVVRQKGQQTVTIVVPRETSVAAGHVAG